MANPDFCVIQAEDGDIFFTITESYNISRSATVTEYRVQSGKKISDHHVSDNKQFKFSGVVTLAEVVGGGYSIEITPDGILTALDKLIEEGEEFTFLSDSYLLGSFALTPNCVLTSYDVNKDAGMEDGIEIAVDIKQIQYGTAVSTSVEIVKPAPEAVDREEKLNPKGKQPTEDINDLPKALQDILDIKAARENGG